jgi:hypothetical protein
MTDIVLLKILWCLSTLTCSLSVVAMIYIYRSMEQSLTVLTQVLYEMNSTKIRKKYGTGIPVMAKDTEVGK